MTVSKFMEYEEFRDSYPTMPLDVAQRFGVNLLTAKTSQGEPLRATCHYLVADGKEGPKTRGALYVDPATDHPYMRIGFSQILERAQEEGGNNTGKFVNKFFRMPDANDTKSRGAWCAGFTSWVLWQEHGDALDHLVGRTPFGAYELGRLWAAATRTPKGMTGMDLSESGVRVTDLMSAKMGDLAIWKHPERFNGHVGIVYGITKLPGSAYTYLIVLEGNGDAHRGQVRMYAYPIELGCHSGSLKLAFLARR